MNEKEYKIIIVGAGPAGIGTACALEEAGIQDYIILEKGNVGNSFKNWPKETRLLTPSFTSNMFMQPDLNAITPLTSPAYSYNTEHLSGEDYAKYLEDITKHFKIKIQENVEVESIEKIGEIFNIKIKNNKEEVESNKESIHQIYTSKYVIWAAGEFLYPRRNSFAGSELCEYYSEIKSFKDLKINNKEERVIIIGGYEAGMDTAYNLAKLNIKILVLDKLDRLNMDVDDPSKSLSPYTVDRCIDYVNDKTILYESDSKISKVELVGTEYVITCENSIEYKTSNKPIFCAGFEGSVKLIENLVGKKIDNNLDINNYDESEKASNLFFTGPSIHTGNVILCFIYKFRMRYATVVAEIAKRENLEDKIKTKKFLDYYKKYNFHLENVQSCDVNCSC